MFAAIARLYTVRGSVLFATHSLTSLHPVGMHLPTEKTPYITTLHRGIHH
jgi:hypothetical protein